MPSSMRALVTGGAGFFGDTLVRGLLEAGVTVRTLDLLPLADPDLAARVQMDMGDVRDPAAVGRAVAGVDLIYHAAALVPITRAGRMFHEVNVEGTRQVLDAAHRGGVKHVVHISSSAVYGIPARVPVDETGPRNPMDEYARSKVAAERLCEAYRARGLAVTMLRPCTIVGPGRLGVLEILFDWIRKGRPVYLLGNGTNAYQLVSARDFADVCVLVATRGIGETFNVGAGEFGSLREDLEGLIRHARTAARIVRVPAALARPALHILDRLRLSPFVAWHFRSIDRDFCIDISKARGLLRWDPKDSNVAMLCQAYDWYLTHAQDGSTETRSPHRRALQHRLLRWFP
jgi:nucleoside-diphosphate-sugar epimerase